MPRSLFNMMQRNNLVKEQMVVECKGKDEGKRQFGKTKGIAKTQTKTQRMDEASAHEMANKDI